MSGLSQAGKVPRWALDADLEAPGVEAQVEDYLDSLEAEQLARDEARWP